MRTTNRISCPNCAQVEQSKQNAEKQTLMASYGQVPVQQFVQQTLTLAASMRKLAKDMPETFVEDIEVGVLLQITGDVFVTAYRGRCSVCGFTITHNHTQPVMEAGAVV